MSTLSSYPLLSQRQTEFDIALHSQNDETKEASLYSIHVNHTCVHDGAHHSGTSTCGDLMSTVTPC